MLGLEGREANVAEISADSTDPLINEGRQLHNRMKKKNMIWRINPFTHLEATKFLRIQCKEIVKVSY
jgi:hypothetical protein